jgi:hypothetical protein
MAPAINFGRRLALIAGAVLLCVISWFVTRSLGSGLVDDSYIFLRYAENFASGLGPVFNPGERVEGYTSPLWLAALTILGVLGADLEVVAPFVSGVLGLALPILILVAMGSGSTARVTAGLIAATFLATHPSVAFWSWTGMDTALSASLSLLTVVLVVHASRRRAFGYAAAAGFSYALSALARPEALVLLPVYVLFLMLVRPEAAGTRIRIVGTFLAPMVLVVASFVARKAYYGSWLPNTYYAKADADRSTLLGHGAEYVGSFLALNALPLVLFVALVTVVVARRQTRSAPWILLISLIAGSVLTTIWVGGDHFPLHRFLLPTLTFVAYGLAHAGAELTRSFPSLRGRRGAILAVAAVVLLGASNTRLVMRASPDTHAQAMMAERWSEVGRWFRENAATDSTMASIVVGAIPYHSKLECIDLLGLTDATVAREGRVSPDAAVGHQRFHTDYVLSRRPTYIVFNQSGLYDHPSPEVGLKHAFALWDIIQDPRTPEIYDLRTVTMANGKVVLFLELIERG